MNCLRLSLPADPFGPAGPGAPLGPDPNNTATHIKQSGHSEVPLPNMSLHISGSTAASAYWVVPDIMSMFAYHVPWFSKSQLGKFATWWRHMRLVTLKCSYLPRRLGQCSLQDQGDQPHLHMPQAKIALTAVKNMFERDQKMDDGQA